MILALGVFDGVHLGHQQIIAKADKVITFDPHPNQGVHLLTTISERKLLIPNLEIITFDEHLSRLSPEAFIRDIIISRFSPSKIIVGYDFAFGYNRSGHLGVLQELGLKYNFQVEVIPEYKIAGLTPKSSTIRHLLGDGDVESAAKLLGRNYTVTGIVSPGKQLGRELGFPTANLQIPTEKLIPAQGVYLGDNCLINVGEIMEVHILEFSGDLYNQSLTVEFVKKIRSEMVFENHEALKVQIEKDLKIMMSFRQI